MTCWQDVPMRDINWPALLPAFGFAVFRLRKLSEPPARGRGWRRYADGAWMDLSLGQVAALGRDELLRHNGIGPRAIEVLEAVMDLAAVGHDLTFPRAARRAVAT